SSLFFCCFDRPPEMASSSREMMVLVVLSRSESIEFAAAACIIDVSAGAGADFAAVSNRKTASSLPSPFAWCGTRGGMNK
ncbi:hypothetical protein TYRP_013781, partial [Tyrophagus putrescentiae]